MFAIIFSFTPLYSAGQQMQWVECPFTNVTIKISVTQLKHFFLLLSLMSRRLNEDNNFVGAVVSEGGGRLWKRCPRKCRRKGHPDWDHCKRSVHLCFKRRVAAAPVTSTRHSKGVILARSKRLMNHSRTQICFDLNIYCT